MTVNSYTQFLALQGVSPGTALFETRMLNDDAGNPLYVGWSLTPNALTSDPVWMIIKLSYDSNGFIDRSQLPNNAQGYKYIWDDQSSYFS